MTSRVDQCITKQPIEKFNFFNNVFYNKTESYYYFPKKPDYSEPFSSQTCITFSRGENNKPHTGLVIINKANESTNGQWEHSLEPGRYYNVGTADIHEVIVPPNGKIKSLRIPGRSSLMLIHESEYKKHSL